MRFVCRVDDVKFSLKQVIKAVIYTKADENDDDQGNAEEIAALVSVILFLSFIICNRRPLIYLLSWQLLFIFML